MSTPMDELAYRLVIDPVRWPTTRRDYSGKLVRDKSQSRDVVREMQTCRAALADPDLTPFHSVLAGELDRLKTGEGALCARLGIAIDLPELERWAMIGSRLAAGQEEFGVGRRRGRPRGAKRAPEVDLLAEIVDEFKSRPEAAGATDFEIVEGLKEDNPRLYFPPDNAINKRLSEARKRRRLPK